MAMSKANGEFEIEHGIEMPVDGRVKYPFDALAVGDSFFVETNKPHNFIRNIYPKNKGGKEFRGRRVDGGVRVWRVA